MKFLCVKCDEAMTLKNVDTSGRNSSGIIFTCGKCSNEIAMLTNPMESQMVKSLGVQLGSMSESYKPMETLGKMLSGGDKEKETGIEFEWSDKAHVRLGNVPEMARPMAKSAIERFALGNGIKTITTEVMDEARKTL